VDKTIKKIIYQINMRLAKLDFESLWTEFHYFQYALYDKTTVYLDNGDITVWDQRFIGNTAIEFQGRLLAIWNIGEAKIKDFDVFTSKLVHEMFHAFQKEKHETRWANEIHGLAYDYNLTNMTLKHQENEMLCQCFEAYDQRDWNDFVSLRLYRDSMYAANVRYEAGIEVIEGMAQYIEIKALRRLNLVKGNKALQDIIKTLKNAANLFPIRKSCYHSGTLLCLVAENAGLTIRHLIGHETKTIFELISEAGEYKVFEAEDENVETNLEKYELYRQLTLKRTVAKATTIIEGDFMLIGMDPLNTFSYQGRIHCRDFVMYQDQETSKLIQQACVLELDAQNHIRKIYY